MKPKIHYFITSILIETRGFLFSQFSPAKKIKGDLRLLKNDFSSQFLPAKNPLQNVKYNPQDTRFDRLYLWKPP